MLLCKYTIPTLLYPRFLAEVNDKGDSKDDDAVNDRNESASVSTIDNSGRDGRYISRIWLHPTQIVKHLIEAKRAEE